MEGIHREYEKAISSNEALREDNHNHRERITEIEAKLAKATELLREIRSLIDSDEDYDPTIIGDVISESGLLAPKSAEDSK